ncbi:MULTISPECIES: translocation/assembly module TamB domain-containing protein [unclassified Mucilaginibacter]|uniref:translocation/assembly module TamB domain-containing protein n=1 Tax=unclassified Mucilaginibacter TaxID=2617802 RepID=UPI000ACAE519|nr:MULTISPECIES: translocation/assembly module TamB domain-containing protein [unclassified Mucilaginibacter]HEK19246.1 translocation/assembly module TamB [Bacteroidota bacterium]
MLIILLLVSIVLMLFQYKPVQTWAAKKATKYLSKELNTTVDVKSLYIKPFSSVVLEGLYILDKQRDTLLSTPKLAVELTGFSVFNSIKQKRLDFKTIQLDNGSFYLKKLKDSTTNLQFVIDYFNSGDTTKTKSKPWTLNFEKITVNNFHFRYKNSLRTAFVKGVNFNDIDVSHFSTIVRNMDLRNHLFKARVTGLTLKEKSGFFVKNFNTNATVDTNQILLQNLNILTGNSTLKNYFRMRFKTFSDLDDFENKVNMDAEFRSSHLSSKDIAYFTDALSKTGTSFELGVDGRVRGLVNNLRATGLTVTAAQSTFIKGDFHLTGLPDWDNTFLQLRFDQIATNKKDMDYLYSHFTGKPNAKVPDVVGKFGNVNFTGRFTGLQNDFVAFGTFKTKLGRFDPDINLKINKAGIPSYSGKIVASNFNLGELINEQSLGRTSFSGNVSGRGDDLKNLNVRGDARIAYLQFKGYTYNNLVSSGRFVNRKANGKLSINDRNVKLNLNGSVDLKPKLPVYNIAGNITNARLQQLKLLKDTITFTTDINTDFSGNNLDNLDGSILLTKIRLDDPRKSYVVDTVNLSASGKGADRIISLRSDIADGSIKGSYDLATLPSYYKTIAKKYIPSLKTEITPPKPQNFDFNLTLKNIEPVTAMFMPTLQIPDQGTFVGKFNSNDKTATLNGYIKTIKLGKIVFHDFIIDESTTDDFLGLNLSLNRIDLTDSLYIKNITITNFLKKDSLNFNVKLSDKSAINQLDLYGLVEFGRDTTAKLKLLPSDIILEHENWKIQEQVRIRLLDGKTQVQNFELSNGKQKVLINGFISDNPADKLKVTFDEFSMATLNQLTKPSGVLLKGALNGDVVLNSLTKKPGVDAKLGIDSLTMNKTLVGDVKLQSVLDNENSRANVKLNITNRGMETMNVDGAYLIGQKGEDDQLDFDIKMDHTEAIIFEPFIKNLVSDVKGSISANVKMTGVPSKPQLNGDITLNNTGLTVNYLKTPYTINDRLTVNNSIITIDGMVLKDIKGGKGEVNGKVDLNNLSNPTLDVTIKATNLQALNTTFKDNHLYYGTAYGTGTFKFAGPIDNMKIDITASTQDGTVFNIPLNTSATASEYDFIRYVNHNDTLQKPVEKKNPFNGVTLNFDLTVNESTIVRISTDYGVLEGSGQARNLKLNINSLGDFEMFGDFLITTGKFEFTAKDFISKNFTVNQGGTIHWTGNPNNAEINLKAIYEVRTNIAPLYTAAGLQSPYGSKQVLVQAELILTKSLLQPNIDFNFTFPVDPAINDDLNTYLADNNNRSQQALSIIVRRSFASGTGTNLTNQVLGTAGEAVSEFAFNKLNSFISQSNIKYFDLNIRSLNDASASLRFWNDRLVINGNLYSTTGTSDLFNTRQSLLNTDFRTLTKDFEIQYLIRKDGNLRAKYSYRALNTTTLNTLNDQLLPQYVNGIGLIYQRDFDTFGEFFRNIFRQSRRNRAPVSPAPVQKPNVTNPVPTKPAEDNNDNNDND